MKLAVDSSSFAKRYVQEVGSEELERFLIDASELAFSVILVPEIISGLNRRLRERILTVADYRTVKKQLMDDVSDATVLQITPSVVSRSVRLPWRAMCYAHWILFMWRALSNGGPTCLSRPIKGNSWLQRMQDFVLSL